MITINTKTQKIKEPILVADKKNILLGLTLIIVDLIYNILSNDALRAFDYGMLLAGLLILLLNTSILNFLKLNKEMVDFISYFLFILMTAIGFLGTGVTYINNFIQGTHDLPNPIYTLFTDLALKNSAFVLSQIRDTTLANNIIDFDGFKVGINYPCSGVESLTVFLSSVIAYFVAKKEKNIKRITTSTLIGIIFLYWINILRIIVIIIVGYSYGTRALIITHNNLGWIFFVIGMCIFWYFVTKEENIKKKIKSE